jgi:radical SAM superfamily enzyme YgiQ (UPF0313 family)
MRIGFVAVSQTQALDTRVHETGQGLKSFLDRWDTIASLPSLALLTLAGMTPARHERLYFETAGVRAPAPPDDGLDLVAISSYTAQIREAYRLASRYREAGVPVVLGGPHVSIRPEEAAEHADAVVIGPGELVWEQVLADAEAGRLAGRYGSLDQHFDLAAAPIPAFELVDPARYHRLTVQTSRGCPHRCEFCASSVLIHGGYHQKPIERVLAEIDRVRDLWQRPFIEFADDNSFVDKRYWKALLPELKRRRVRWFTEADLSIARDKELLRLMRESGCKQVLIGLESPVAADLDGLDMKRNWKHAQAGSYREAIRTIQSHGITVNGCFVVGMDTQGPEIFDILHDFIRETELFEVQVTILTPFPGTPLYERLLREGRLLDPTAWERCTLYDVNFQPARMSVDELRDGFLALGRRIYNDEAAQWRRDQFKKHWRAVRHAG